MKVMLELIVFLKKQSYSALFIQYMKSFLKLKLDTTINKSQCREQQWLKRLNTSSYF
jgi:hypothetical protein